MNYWKSLNRKLRLAQTLTLREWLTLLEAWQKLLFFRVALLGMSFRQLDDFTRAEESSAANHPAAQADAERLGALIHYAAQMHLPPMSCLPRSLALKNMLGARGIPAQVKIGARKINHTLHAHAWVEVRGQPIGETQDVTEKFSALRGAAHAVKER